MFSGYRSPCTLILDAALSISRRSSDVSSIATAPMFSSRRVNFVLVAVRVVDNDQLRVEAMSGRLGLLRPNHWRTNSLMARIRLNCAKRTAHSAGYLMKRGREFKSRLDHHPVRQFWYSPENRRKSACVRRFARARGARESSKSALRCRIGQKLSGRRFGRSILAPAGKRRGCPKGGLHNKPRAHNARRGGRNRDHAGSWPNQQHQAD